MTLPPKPFLTPSGSRWLPDDTPPEGQQAARIRLASILRETIEVLMDTEAPEDDLEAAAQAAEAFTARLAAFPQSRALWGYAESSNSGDVRAMFDSSPLIGRANPVAPPLKLAIVGDHIEGTAVYGAAYEGPPGHVHGGILAASFDEVLGMTQSLSGISGMTGKLNVTYRRPTPLHQEVTFHGRVTRVDGRKIFCSGTLHAGEVLCAEADAIFISVDFERMRALASQR